MNAELIILVVCTFITAFGLSGINYNGFFKKEHIMEARVLVMVLSFSFGYLLTQFVLVFLNL